MGTRARAVACALAVAALGSLSAPTQAQDLLPRLEPWPLWMRDATPVAGLRTTTALGPFFRSFETGDGRSGWALPPLFARVHEAGTSRFELLYPLGQLRRQSGETWLRFTPLLDLRSTRASGGAPGGTARSRWTFVLAFGGRAETGERSFGVFPLGGVARKRFGLERLRFWLFPLYASSEDATGFRRTTVLWPLFSWGSGGGRRLLRLWPFYGYDRREGTYDRSFALWPFVHWRREGIGGLGERRVRLLLPFYGDSVRKNARARFVLGPLYVEARNDLTGERSRDFLWPLMRVASRAPEGDFPGSSELRLEPLFRRRVGPEGVRTATLLGAVEHAWLSTEVRRRRGWRFLWVSRFDRTTELESGRERLRRDLWPFFRLEEERSAQGAVESRSARAPWLLPLRGEGWERSWLAPITLFEHRSRGEESRSDWLWGVLRSRRTAERSVDSLGWLVRHENRADGGQSLRLLGLPVVGSD